MRKILSYLLTILSFLISTCGIVFSQTIDYSILYEERVKVSTIQVAGIEYISASDLAGRLNARKYFNESTKKLNIYLDDNVVKISSFNPFIVINQNTYQLHSNTLYRNKDIFVPKNDFISLLKSTINTDLAEPNNVSRETDTNIEEISIEEKANGTLIKIKVSRNFSQHDIGFRERHRWLYVDIYGGIVDTNKLRKNFDEGLISQIIPLQLNDNMTQLSFKLRKTILEKQFFLENPNEILISLKTQNNISEDIIHELEREKKKWLIDKIVIDPGHGGKDPGAIGKGNTYEKNVVLAISLELARLFVRKTDIEVLMTRDDDKFIELKKRTEFANKHGAKLFISIHANSNPYRSIRGVSTYFLGTGKSEEAREVALLENSVIKYEKDSQYADLSNENFILSAMAQNVYNSESEDFADIVQKHISRKCRLQNRGVKQAGFYVLWGASMPNILIETAFLSNIEEEKKLNNRSFQKKMAEAIFDSVMEFKAKYEKGI